MQAIRERRRLSLTYLDLEERESRRVVVRPLGLTFWGETWTLAAWCETRGAFRTFRVDRMKEWSLTELFRTNPAGCWRTICGRRGPRLEQDLSAVPFKLAAWRIHVSQAVADARHRIEEEAVDTLEVFAAIPDAALAQAVTPAHRDLARLGWHLVESLISMPATVASA